MSKRAQDDIDRIREAVRLRGGNALKTHVPVTPAGRWAALEMLLSPVYVETCPCCGQDVERRGGPLISREAALEMLAGGGEDE